MASASGYKPLSTIPDVIVTMKGPDKGGNNDVSDLTGLGYENTIEELSSYFLNRRDFPAMYPASSFILLLGDPGISRYSLVAAVCSKMGMECMQVCLPPEINSSYSGGKEAMMEYYLKQATEASEEKDVILYFDEAELGLISEISTDIPAKITLVGATDSSANLDNALLSKVSKYINIPPPPLSARIRFIKNKMVVNNFTNKIGDMEMEFIGQETEKYSFKDLERLWLQSCDILFSQLRNPGDHGGEEEGHGARVVIVQCQEYKGVPCNCEVTCKQDEESISEMKMTGGMVIRALSSVRTAVHHDMISEDEYIKKFHDFVGKKESTSANNDETNKNCTEDVDDDTDPDCSRVLGLCMFTVIALIIFAIILLTLPKPSWRTD